MASVRRRVRGERLFVATPLPDSARDALAAALPPLPGRRVLPEKWHFTLRFLGDTAATVRDALIGELAARPFGEPFAIRLLGLGAFPKAARARVLWIGVEQGAERLRFLASQVATACADVGIRADDRPYSPHLTLSRVDPPQDLRSIVAQNASIAIESRIGEVLLLRSTPGSGHPRYETLARYPLHPAQ